MVKIGVDPLPLNGRPNSREKAAGFKFASKQFDLIYQSNKTLSNLI